MELSKRVLDKVTLLWRMATCICSSSWLWKNNPGNQIYQTLRPANPDLGSNGHHSSTMGRPDYPAFLSDESQAEQLISQDLKHPKLITVATYPGSTQRHEPSRRSILKLGIPMTRQRLKHLISKALISLLLSKPSHSGTLCLDECHHLRNEWWKSLEAFRQAFPDLKMISPHRHPPYEGDPALGIAISACVVRSMRKLRFPIGQGRHPLSPPRLCLLAFPTKEEQEQLDAFSQQKNALLQQLTSDPLFANTSKPARPYLVRLAIMNCSMSPSISLPPWSFFVARESSFPNVSKTFRS